MRAWRGLDHHKPPLRFRCERLLTSLQNFLMTALGIGSAETSVPPGENEYIKTSITINCESMSFAFRVEQKSKSWFASGSRGRGF